MKLCFRTKQVQGIYFGNVFRKKVLFSYCPQSREAKASARIYILTPAEPLSFSFPKNIISSKYLFPVLNRNKENQKNPKIKTLKYSRLGSF